MCGVLACLSRTTVLLSLIARWNKHAWLFPPDLLNFGFASFAWSIMLKSALQMSVCVLKVVATFNLHLHRMRIFHSGQLHRKCWTDFSRTLIRLCPWSRLDAELQILHIWTYNIIMIIYIYMCSTYTHFLLCTVYTSLHCVHTWLEHAVLLSTHGSIP